MATTPTRASDEDLLEHWAKGDDRAGALLVERHFDTVYRFFVRRQSEGAADLVQRTFLACIEARDRLSHVVSFRAFLLGIARHQLLRDLRRTDAGRRAMARFTLSESPAASPTTFVSLRQEQRLLLLALRQLPLGLQLAIELYYWEDMTTSEIGEVLGIARGTVMNRLFRARQRLETLMADATTDELLLASTRSNLIHWAQSLRQVQQAVSDELPRARSPHRAMEQSPSSNPA